MSLLRVGQKIRKFLGEKWLVENEKEKKRDFLLDFRDERLDCVHLHDWERVSVCQKEKACVCWDKAGSLGGLLLSEPAVYMFLCLFVFICAHNDCNSLLINMWNCKPASISISPSVYCSSSFSQKLAFFLRVEHWCLSNNHLLLFTIFLQEQASGSLSASSWEKCMVMIFLHYHRKLYNHMNTLHMSMLKNKQTRLLTKGMCLAICYYLRHLEKYFLYIKTVSFLNWSDKCPHALIVNILIVLILQINRGSAERC